MGRRVSNSSGEGGTASCLQRGYPGGIMGMMTSFPGMRGGTVQGYSSRPGEGKGPAVVVIQEWWGVQGQVKAVCDRLALMGFNALAPDLYGGKVIPYHDQAAASAAASSLDFNAAVENAVRGGVVHLTKSASKFGLPAFCIGGARLGPHARLAEALSRRGALVAAAEGGSATIAFRLYRS